MRVEAQVLIDQCNRVDRCDAASDAGAVEEPLGGGLVLRPARPADRDRIGALLTERGDAADAVDHALVVDDPDAGYSSCAVVVDGSRVVSTAVLLDETLHLGGVPIPTGQVELVATDPAYEGRGLMRALIDHLHRLSAARGHLVQVLLGIPYFYRLFGYQYAVDLPQARAVRGVPPSDGHHTVRRAGPADIPAMARLQEAVQSRYDLWMPHTAATWRWLVARDGSAQLVVERDGVVVATGRITPAGNGGPVLGEVAATDAAGIAALLAQALSSSEGVEVLERPALEPFLAPRPPRAASYYVRVPDVVALLDHLRPVLSARLATAGARGDGEVIVSFFRHHVRLRHRDGVVHEVVPGGRMQAPGAAGGAGVAPDLVAPLLFGPLGIEGMAGRHPDVYPGRDEALMSALFPPVRADLLTFYLP